MKIENSMITQRQFLIMVFIGGMVIKGFMLPSLLMLTSGRDSLFVMIFYFLVEIINLTCIALLIKLYPNKNFFCMMEDCFGKILSRIFILAFLFAAGVKFVLNLSEVKAFFSSSMFSSVTWEIMIIPLIAICFILGVKSLRILGRSAEIFFPFIAICLVLLAFILFGEVRLENILPLGENGIEPVMKGIAEFPIWFGDVIVMSVAMGNVKPKKRFVTYTIITRAIVAVSITMLATVMFATYGNIIPLIKHGHNVTSLTQYDLGSQEFGRFDLLLYSVWLFGVFIKMAMNFYFCLRSIAFIINRPAYYIIGAVVAVLAYVFSIFVFPTLSSVYMLSTTAWIKCIFAFMEYLMPVILLIAASIRYRKKPAKENKNEQVQPQS